MRNLIVFSTLLLLFASCKKEMPLLKANRDQEIMLSVKSFLAAEMSPQEWAKVQFSGYSIARAGDTLKAVLVECKKLHEWGGRWVVVTPTAAGWSASIMELEYRDSLKQEGRAGWYALNGLPLRTLPVSKGRLVKGGTAGASRSFGMEMPVEVMVNYTSFLNYQYAVLCNMYGGPGGENFYIQMPGGGGGSGY